LELLAKRGPYRERALALLENMQGPGGPWVWKDPRLCLLLPFWKQLWGEVSFIVTVRDPLEIAESLHYRDDFSLGGALLLWELMTSLVLADPEILDSALFCSYEQLVDDAVPTCARICGFLDRRIGITQQEADPRPALMANAVSPELRRNRASVPFCKSSIASADQKELQLLLRLHAAGEVQTPRKMFWPAPGWRDRLAAEAAGRQQSLNHFQVYWRGASTDYCEPQSRWVKLRPISLRQAVRVALPADLQGGPSGLRLDFGEQEGVLSIHELAVRDARGETVWVWDRHPDSIERLVRNQLSLFEEQIPGLGCMLRLEGTDPWVELVLDAAQASALQAGGAVDLECTFFSLPTLFAQALAWSSQIEVVREQDRISAGHLAAEEPLPTCESQVLAAARMSALETCLRAGRVRVQALETEVKIVRAELRQTQARIGVCESQQKTAAAHVDVLDRAFR
jgi:hypothetical protein